MPALAFTLSLSALRRPAIAAAVSNWILASGAWNDSGVWDDAETWNDS